MVWFKLVAYAFSPLSLAVYWFLSQQWTVSYMQREEVIRDESIESQFSTNATYRTMRLFEVLSYHPGERVESLERLVHIPLITLQRLLKKLENLGFASCSNDGSWRLTPALFTLASRNLDDVELSQLAKPYLEDCAYELGETTLLSIRSGNAVADIVTIESKYNNHPSYDQMLARHPLYCTAAGRVLLAGMRDTDLRSYLQHEEMRPYTEATVTDPNRLYDEIQDVRKAGYASCAEEYVKGQLSLACPVLDTDGRVIAAVSILWPLFRNAPELHDRFLGRIQSIARQVSILMGYVSKSVTEQVLLGNQQI